MASIFVTGFPGFLGSALIERLLERYAPDVSIVCLTQPKFRSLAEERARKIEARQPAWAGRIRLYDGDITAPDLGLGANLSNLQKETRQIFHFAAVYDLAVTKALAMRVNVDGTRYTLDFAQNCPNLERFQYVSTCYVSGRAGGFFRETDLERGQTFNNYYEETKYLAEVDVQRRMRDGLPGTIYRPSIVQGDSHTGETQKYDGPYYIIRWIMRQPKIAIAPVTGDPYAYEVNVVPRDYVTDAIDWLSAQELSAGKVYQLSDPTPPTVGAVLDAIGQHTRRRVIKLRLPHEPTKWAMKNVPGISNVSRIQAEAVDYFKHPTRYRCEETVRDLAGSGISCPPYLSYLGTLIDYVRAHPNISAAAMV
jgi:thioester reductase-like protein